MTRPLQAREAIATETAAGASADAAADRFPASANVQARLREAGIDSVAVARRIGPDGERLGLLVADDDISTAAAQARRVAGVSVTLFTPAGAKSGGFRLDNPAYSEITLAILPLELADELLDRAALASGLDAQYRFRLAAYVEAYFGGTSRLVGGIGEAEEGDDLPALARVVGVDPEICRDRASLDTHLAEIGWRPSIDMLERLGLADSWIRDDLLPELLGDHVAPPGLAVFFCRERAVELGHLKKIRMAIKDTGFEIVQEGPLEGDLATMVRRSVRGGNWGAGPWPVNGGPPVHLLFAIDVYPTEPDAATHARHPFLDNARVLAAKFAARDAVLAHIPSRERFNPLHSTDNSAETLRFAASVLPEDAADALDSTFASRLADVDALIGDAVPVEGNNIVALNVRVGEGKKARIRKIYRRQYVDSLCHGAELLEKLSADWPELPSLQKRGDTYLEIDYLGQDFVPIASLGGMAPISTVLRLRNILRAVLAAGYDPIGWDPGLGILVSPTTGEIRIPGFDRLHHWPEPPRMNKSICLTGPALGEPDGYRLLWYPLVGVPRSVFLRGGPVAMRLHRSLIFPIRRSAERFASGIEGVKTRLRPRIRTIRRMLGGWR